MEILGLLGILFLGLLVGWVIILITSSFTIKTPGFSFVLGVKNQEAHIEGVIRGVFSIAEKTMPELSVVVLDLGSQDQTPAILARLNKQYYGMELINGRTYLEGLTPEEVAALNCSEDDVYYLKWDEAVNHLQIVPLINRLLQALDKNQTMEVIQGEELVIKKVHTARRY